MNAKTIVFGLVVLAAVGGGAYYVGVQNRVALPGQPAVPTPAPAQQTDEQLIPTSAATTSPTSSASSGQAVDERETLKVVIKQALVAKHGSSANELTITVSKVQGNYAQGGASATGGGAMWLAAKVGGTWRLVWDGNGTISCSDLAPYPDFPTSMAPECWNETTQKSVTR